MTDSPDNLVLAQLNLIRAEIAKGNGNTATLAEAVVGLRRDLDRQSARIDSLAEGVAAMRHDIRAIAIAIDGHGTRLTHIETQLDNIHLDRHPN
jgi:hypothetical protein